MRILLTRPEADAERSAETLSALGHTCVIAPLFEIAATKDAKPTGTFTTLLATSAHAFDAAHLDGDLRNLPLHVVGERTADAARQNGFQNIRHIAADGTALAKAIGAGAENLLYLAGRERRPELEALLKAQGQAITPWIVYETRTCEALPAIAHEALASGMIDAVLHFSTRSAELYCILAKSAGLEAQALKPAQIAISSRAGAVLNGAERIAIAPTPDFEGVLSALKAL